MIGKYELRTIGVDIDEYNAICAELGITLIVYDIVEMGVPVDEPPGFQSGILKLILKDITKGKKVMCHCRGGVGRAGTVAACLLLEIGLAKRSKEVIEAVRRLRDKRAVESRKQVDYIKRFRKHLLAKQGPQS